MPCLEPGLHPCLETPRWGRRWAGLSANRVLGEVLCFSWLMAGVAAPPQPLLSPLSSTPG